MIKFAILKWLLRRSDEDDIEHALMDTDKLSPLLRFREAVIASNVRVLLEEGIKYPVGWRYSQSGVHEYTVSLSDFEFTSMMLRAVARNVDHLEKKQ